MLKKDDLSIVDKLVKDNLEYLNIEHFYTSYLCDPKCKENNNTYNLKLGEISGINYTDTVYEMYCKFVRDNTLLQDKLSRYGGTFGTGNIAKKIASVENELIETDDLDEYSIIFYGGGQDAISSAVSCTVSPYGCRHGKKQYVLTASPSYPYIPIILNEKAGVISFLAFSAEEFVQGVERFANEYVGAILVNSPNNPIGYVLEKDHIRRINDAAQKYDCAIIVDMVYSRFSKYLYKNGFLGLFDPKRTIYLDSFSKSFGLPGLRLGFAFSRNKELCAVLRAMKSSHSLLPSAVKLLFAGYLMDNYGDYTDKIRQTLIERVNCFNEAFPDLSDIGVKVSHDSENLFYQCIYLTDLCRYAACSIDDIAKICEKKYGLYVTSGDNMYPDQSIKYFPVSDNSFIPEMQYICSDDFIYDRKSFIRLSFGIEKDTSMPAAVLAEALLDIYNSR